MIEAPPVKFQKEARLCQGHSCDLKKNLNLIWFYVCDYFACMYVCVPHTFRAQGIPKRVLDFPGNEVMSMTWVIRENKPFPLRVAFGHGVYQSNRKQIRTQIQSSQDFPASEVMSEINVTQCHSAESRVWFYSIFALVDLQYMAYLLLVLKPFIPNVELQAATHRNGRRWISNLAPLFKVPPSFHLSS